MIDSIEYLTFEMWRSKKFLLLMGSGAQKEDIDALARHNIPVRGVLTTSCDSNTIQQYKNWLAEAFHASVSSTTQIKSGKGTQEISLVHLLESDDTSDINSYFEDEQAVQEPEFKLDRLQRALMGNSALWVIGFNGLNPYDKSCSRSLLSALDKRGPKTVFFWGMRALPENEPFRKYAERRDQGFFQETLADSLKEAESDWGADEDNVQTNPVIVETQTDFYYSGGIPTSVDAVQLKRYAATALVLTWGTVTSNQPRGKFEQQEKFKEFLVNSCNEGPEWYGYSEKSPFYVTRDRVDRRLHDIVNSKFEEYKQDNKSKIIAVGGPAGSGKSVALANLCYTVFMEREHPVVFIPRTTALVSDTSDQFQQLNDLLHFIEVNSHQKKTCILLVWDCSSYHERAELAEELCKNLNNQGRKDFVLVYSTYEPQKDNERKGKGLNLDRTFTNLQEKQKFIEKVERYGGFEKEVLDQLRQETKNITDSFTWFYQVLFYMQDALGKSFFRENSTVSSYISKTQEKILKLQKARQASTERNGQLQWQLKKAGLLEDLDVSEAEGDSEGNKDKKDTEGEKCYNIFSFFAALFTLLGIPLYDNLADVIMSDDLVTEPEDISFVYDERRQIIRNTLVDEIPWIVYQEAPGNEESCFVFRSTAEAEIFLSQYSEEELVDKVCRLLEVCRGAYLRFNFVPGKSLSKLLRMIGPNTSDPHFRPSAREQWFDGPSWGGIQKFYDRIINCLARWNQVGMDTQEKDYTILRLVYGREYYSNVLRCNPDEDDFEKYEERISKLIQCIYDAQKEADALNQTVQENPRLQLPLNNIRVELLFSQWRCADILDEYDKACYQWQHNQQKLKEFKSALKKYKASYAEAFGWMQSAIARDPSNGYYYIALFRCFRREFVQIDKQEEKMRRSQEIQLYVDQVTSSRESMINCGGNGRDELGDECTMVQDLIDRTFSGFDISISSVLENKLPEASRSVYQQLLKGNSSAGISFVIRRELEREAINLFSENPLTERQIEACKRALCFAEEQSKQFSFIKEEYYICFTMLRLKWAIWNGVPFNGKKERQVTYLDKKQWDAIYSDCLGLKKIVQREKITVSPIFVVIYALSEFQSKETIGRDTKGMLDDLRSMRGKRMFSPYMITDQQGNIRAYHGVVKEAPQRNSYVGKISIRTDLGSVVANFNNRYIDYSGRLQVGNTTLSGLALGISYSGFQTYSLSKLPKCEEGGGRR